MNPIRTSLPLTAAIEPCHRTALTKRKPRPA